MTPRTSSAAWVRSIADMFAAEGLPAADLCTEAGIDLPALQQQHTRVDVDRVSRLWEAAAARYGQPGLGLARDLAARYGNVDLVGYALASGPNLLIGFEHLQRHMALISDATTFEMQRDPRGQGHWLAISHIGASRPIPRQRIEFAVLTLFMLCCWLTRRDLVPQAVELTTAPPHDDDARYRAAFGLLPRFGQPANRFLLADADLLAPIPTHNPSLWALHERMVESELDQLGQTLASTRVRTEIARVLHLGEPRREDIAARLHLTDRTLQRRLQAESVSYQQLLDDTRCELARQHLSDARRSLGEIADLLGFADQSNLFRACKRWFGMPPGQYRAQVLQPEHEAAS
ncbi:AraC family transcriptional regulator [Acidovorax sp. LjRoot129]|uniref:AraC family transcriptional regulator n=1 Tax=Acidovorax sp. LjRoot129 TaxID=3342260 RepID=UPI003ECCAEA4